MLNYILIFAAWIIVVFFILRFFSVCSDRNRSGISTKITLEEILDLDPFISDDAIKFTGLDDCIVGTDQRGLLVYSYDKMIAHFQKDGMSIEEAIEYIDFNVVGIKPDNYTVLYHE
jgi:hypothetical protein|tara:strand:- start:164 stop:511 length:348 start_codon:yes stop_codon:yes gene_type:complete